MSRIDAYHILGHESVLQSFQSRFQIRLLQICLSSNTGHKDAHEYCYKSLEFKEGICKVLKIKAGASYLHQNNTISFIKPVNSKRKMETGQHS